MFTRHTTAIALALLISPAYGQSSRAELFGTIRDPAGLSIPAAQAELREQNTQISYRLASSSEGRYRFLALPPGLYELTIRKQGFQTLHETGIQLRVGDLVELDLALQIGGMTEAVEVTAAAPLLQSASGGIGFVVDQTKVANLPLDGRNFVPLIALVPGVMLPPGQVLPRVNGSRPRTSEYRYDGVSVLQPEPGQVAYYPIPDAIEEFRVDTNSYSAEFGRSNGGVVQVSTKSGTNDFHGTLFEFFRNETLNARNLFASQGPKPPFKRNQYGFVFGGPLQRNRSFFFVDWQGSRLRTGVTRFSTVPTSLERQGVFPVPVYDPDSTTQTPSGFTRTPFADNAIPREQFDAAALALLPRYPSPNIFTPTGEAAANNYGRAGEDTGDADQFDTRLDRYFGAHQRVFGRYSYLRDDSRPMTPLPGGSGALTTSVIGNTLTRGDSVVAEHAWTPSPESVNQLRFGFTRRGFDRQELKNAAQVYDLAGFQQLGPTSSANGRFATSVTEFIDDYSTFRGRHSFKLGADVRIERLDVLQPPNPSGDFQLTPVLTSGLSPSGTPLTNTGNSFASFLLGQVQNFTLDAQQDVLKPRAKIAEFFVQDDWKPTRRLGLNLGLRYTLNFPSTEANNRGAVFNLNTRKLDLLGQNGYPRTARNLEKGDFGPRIGLAYRLTDSFVVRAGYGLTWIEQAGITTPFTTPLFPFIQTITQRSLDNRTPAFVLSQGPSIQITPPGPDSGLGQGVFGVQRDNGSGYAQQWNFTLQKTIGTNWSAEVGYAGSKLTRLGVPDTNLNQLSVAQLALGSVLTSLVPNPYFGQIPVSSSLGAPSIAEQQLLRPFPRFTTVTLYRNNVGNSTYHSFQSRLERRFSRGLTLSATYTFSKLIDDAGSVFDSAILTGPVATFQAADSFNRHLEKDESTGSIPHVFSAGFVYELPFTHGLAHGWKIGGIVRAQSGMLIAVTQATNFNSFAGFGIQRPNRTADPNLPNDQRTTARYFNTAAFATAPQFTIGSSSRNPVRGPGYQAADLMIGKLFHLTDRVGAEFRTEAFNVTNTPPLGQPNGTFGSPAFGTITTALDPRDFELVLKLIF